MSATRCAAACDSPFALSEAWLPNWMARARLRSHLLSCVARQREQSAGQSLPTCAQSGADAKGALRRPPACGSCAFFAKRALQVTRRRGRGVAHARCIADIRTRGIHYSSQTLRRPALVALPHRCRLRRHGEPRPSHSLHAVAARKQRHKQRVCSA